MVYDFNEIRQGVGIAFIGLAFYFTYNDNLLGFLLSVLLASLFHRTALVFLPFYFLRHIRLKRSLLTVFLIITFCISSVTDLTAILIKIVSVIIGTSNQIFARLYNYAHSTIYGSNIFWSFSTFQRIIIFIVIYISTKYYKNKKLSNLLLLSETINIVIYLLLAHSQIIATRLSIYYRFAQCISLAGVPTVFKGKWERVFAGFLVFLYCLLMIITTIRLPLSYTLKYQSVLDAAL
jgi:hypothetical protein